jgi:hypothetical protein
MMKRRNHRQDRSSLFSGADTSRDIHSLAGASSRRTISKKKSTSGIGSASTAAEEARSIADSLQRTKAMMRQELERVSAVSQAIDRDGTLLREAKTEHMGLHSLVKGARRTLGVLKRQDMQEAVVLWGSVVVFYVVALYVLWTRIRIPFFLW